jgi:hypothetical protein
MRQKRSSQSLTPHHHASEHSNFFTIIGSQLAPLPRSDNPSQRTRTSFPLPTHVENINRHTHPDAPKPIHPDKEQFCSSTLKLGTNIRPLLCPDLFRNRNKKKIETRSPRNNSQQGRHSANLINSKNLDTSMVEMDGIEPTTPCLQSRCSTN